MVNVSDKTIRLYCLDENGIYNSELQFSETVNKDNWNQCCFNQGGDYVIGGKSIVSVMVVVVVSHRTISIIVIIIVIV